MKSELSGQLVNGLTGLAARLNQLLDNTLQSQQSLSLVQYKLLNYLSASPEGVNQQSLAVELGVDKSTISRNISVLDRKGLVSRKHTLSGRDLLVKLTTKGNNQVAKATELVSSESAKLFAKFSMYEQKQFSIWIKTLESVLAV